MRIIILMLLVVTSAIALSAQPQATPGSAVRAEIKQQLGFVPSAIMAQPDEALSSSWGELQALEGRDTALPAKSKHLIALGVSAQMPCRMCAYAGTQFARAAGATDRELKEAITQAAITRHWSTVLNGMQIDASAFDKEVQAIFVYVRKGQPQASGPVTDAESAYKDMQATLGIVPTFFKAFPEKAIAPAWLEYKNVELNPQTALDGKTKELIGLAVSAQIPCPYCVTFHTTAAKANGASDDEIKEAVAMAAVTRYWSTVATGSLQDETQFRREVDLAIKNRREKAPAAAQR
jgi:AhpD family alkylhydroperoxidase